MGEMKKVGTGLGERERRTNGIDEIRERGVYTAQYFQGGYVEFNRQEWEVQSSRFPRFLFCWRGVSEHLRKFYR